MTDGSVVLLTVSTKVAARVAVAGEGAVKGVIADIQWDGLSTNYMLVGFKSGHISLWDMEDKHELFAFDRVVSELGALRGVCMHHQAIRIALLPEESHAYTINYRVWVLLGVITTGNRRPCIMSMSGLWHLTAMPTICMPHQAISFTSSPLCHTCQGSGISALAWMPWAAGNFVSVNPRTGVLRVFNVSQKQVMSMAANDAHPMTWCCIQKLLQ
jgi:hypothetical protein